MKKIIIALILISLGYSTMAQAYFSCTQRSVFVYNETTESYDLMQSYEETSLFELNENLTMFTHTTPNMKSTYYIKDQEYDEESSIYLFDVVSDVGNKYTYIFDLENKVIKVVFEDDNEIRMLLFTVKHMWYDE
ncbi:MAG: hypothetical protein Q4D03_01365 [Bacteroidales bacterium]|nr:hypothetical protein [Bacteroidales bacterium]